MTTLKTADLRRWWRKGNAIHGYVYNDPDDFYDDGEFAELVIDVLIDNGGFYILKSFGKTFYKLYKSDEHAH